MEVEVGVEVEVEVVVEGEVEVEVGNGGVGWIGKGGFILFLIYMFIQEENWLQKILQSKKLHKRLFFCPQELEVVTYLQVIVYKELFTTLLWP